MGYIKLFREIQEWEWWDDPNTLAMWVHLLVCANWKDTVWHGETIQRGSLVTTISRLAEETGLSDKQVRTCIDRLAKTGEIIKEGTNKWTKITICKYEDYQSAENDVRQTDGEQSANERQTIGEQMATIEEVKKERKEEVKKIVPLSDSVNRIYALYPSTAKRPDGNRVALKSAKKNKAHITRMLGSGEYTEESLTYAIKRYLDEANPEYIKMFETFLNQVPDYGGSKEQQTPTQQAEKTSYEDAVERAKNPTKEEIKAWWDKRMAPFYPKNPGESNEQYRKRVRPSYESELKSWIENRVERVNQRYL